MEELRIADYTPNQALAEPSGEYPNPIDVPFQPSQLSFE